MQLDPELNKILKEMWRLDEKFLAGEALTKEEKEFYNDHLPIIVEYYETSNRYWNSKRPFKN